MRIRIHVDLHDVLSKDKTKHSVEPEHLSGFIMHIFIDILTYEKALCIFEYVHVEVANYSIFLSSVSAQ